MTEKRANLGDRMKLYERSYDQYLTPRLPVFIRIDGKSFHTFTKRCDKPFDQGLRDAMVYAMEETAKEMSGFILSYHQSDEVTFMLRNDQTNDTQPWFDNRLNKLCSITSSMFTTFFNAMYGSAYNAYFDARAFTVPLSDAPNAFIWRQQDWYRNSIQMMGQAHFSHKELQNKSNIDIQGMLADKGFQWNDIAPEFKYGTFYHREYGIFNKLLSYEELVNYMT